MKGTKRIGELLVERGILTPSQVEAALEAQRGTGEFLGKILIRRGWITEEQLLEAFSEQFQIPRIRMEKEKVDWEAAGQFSIRVLTEHACFPIRQDTASVTVAISNPLDAWVVEALEKEAKGRSVRLVLATDAEIRSALHTYLKKR